MQNTIVNTSKSGLESLLSPRSVAVVGASDNPDKVGGRPLKYLLTQGYTGRVYPVNPRAQTVQGVQAYPALDLLPEVPEVAILCVGAEHVEAQLRMCVRLGVANAIMFASGFSEVGPEGRLRQQQIADICRDGNVRLLGPNCIGVADFSNGAVLSFASIYNDFPPKDGPIAVVSQSGAIGVCAYALLRDAGLGVRYVAATGNEADIDTLDFVEAVANRPGIELILLYLEDVKSLERLEAALATTSKNGIALVALRSGKSADGKRSAGWHTGSSGAVSSKVDALFERYGCRTVNDLGELVASVPLYLSPSWTSTTSSRVPTLAIVSNSGAACVMASDEAAKRGIPLAIVSSDTTAQLDDLLPDFSLNRNPVDLTAMLLTDSALLGNAMRTVLNDPAVDAAVLGLLAIGGPSYDTKRFARDSIAVTSEAAKPLVVYSPHPHVRTIFAEHGHAVFASESDALEAIQGFFSHRTKFQSHRAQTQPDTTKENNYV